MLSIVLSNLPKKTISLPFIRKFIFLVKLIKKQTILIYLLFFAVSIVLISLFRKSTLHLFLNKYHSNFFDVLFKYATYLGDGIMFGVLFLCFLFVKKRVAYAFAIGGFLTLLVTYLFKKVIFSGLPRPVQLLGVDNLHLIEGVKMAFWNTFPSGHTTTAFAIFTILCLYFNKCKSQYLWVSLAIIAGLSRVYLSQHFWLDIFVGSFIGIIIGFVSMMIFYKPNRVRSLY